MSRRLAPFPLVLGCSPPLVGIDTESSEAVQETPHPLYFLSPHAARAPHQFSGHHALRQSRVLNTRHKSLEQDPSHLDALPSRLHKRVEIGNRVASAIFVSPADAASQEAVACSAQRVVVARARTPRDAAVQHCLECLGLGDDCSVVMTIHYILSTLHNILRGYLLLKMTNTRSFTLYII